MRLCLEHGFTLFAATQFSENNEILIAKQNMSAS
jgi:hypothetical protein